MEEKTTLPRNEWVIVTHVRPHIDEILGIYLLKHFGKEKFPGIEKAKIEFWDSRELRGFTPKQWLEKGYILVGIGGGAYDEHPVVLTENSGKMTAVPKKKNDCAATLVAKDLCVENLQELYEILTYVKNNDLFGDKGDKNSFANVSPANLLKRVWSLGDYLTGMTDLQIVEHTLFTIGIVHFDNMLVEQAKAEFAKKKCTAMVTNSEGKKLVVASIASDSEHMNKAVRLSNPAVAVLIQKNSKGNVTIFTNRAHKVDLTDVVRMIRLKEQLVDVYAKDAKKDWVQLAMEGEMPGVKNWYYQKEAEMLFNGSLTAPDVPPTKLKLDVILDAVKIGLSAKFFADTHKSSCEKGKCTSTFDSPCWLYKFGLNRCQLMRELEGGHPHTAKIMDLVPPDKLPLHKVS